MFPETLNAWSLGKRWALWWWAEADLMVKETLAQTRARMTKVVEELQHELAAVRTDCASTALLHHLKADYYGTPTPLNQVATLGVPEPTLITVQPWDASLLPAIEKAIRSSDLGLNPVNDGKILRVPLPPLTEERRKELVKHVHALVEKHRLTVRNLRREANETLKKLLKDKKISEDDERRGLEESQKLTDEFISKLDLQGTSKEQEILEMRGRQGLDLLMKIITLRPMGVLLSPPVRGMKIKNEPSAAVPRGPQILFQNNPIQGRSRYNRNRVLADLRFPLRITGSHSPKRRVLLQEIANCDCEGLKFFASWGSETLDTFCSHLLHLKGFVAGTAPVWDVHALYEI